MTLNHGDLLTFCFVILLALRRSGAQMLLQHHGHRSFSIAITACKYRTGTCTTTIQARE